MAILDTFFIMFESDASKLDDGLDKANQKTKKLEQNLKSTDAVGGKLGGSFSNLLGVAGGAISGVLSFGAIAAGITNAADYADALNDVAERLGVNISELDAWGNAVKMAGGTAEGFQGSLETLSADFAMIATKGTSRTLPFWKQMGIQLKDANGKMRDVMDVLPELADKFAGMSKQESIGMGKKLGLDTGTISLLQQGRREVEEVIKKQKELGVVNEEQAKASAEFNDALDEMKISFRGLFLTIGQSVLPAFKWVTEGITKLVVFFRQHKNFAEGLFIAIASAITYFLLPALISAGIAAWTAFAPLLLMAAIVGAIAVAFALLYDDVANFLEGNNSMIGELSQKYPIVGEAVKGLAATFQFLWAVVEGLFNLLLDLFDDPMNAWNNFVNAIYAGLDNMSAKFPEFFQLIQDGAAKIMDIIAGIKSFFGISGSVSVAQTNLTKANATPLNKANSAVIQSGAKVTKSTNVTVGKVEVKTQATDANGIARSVGGQLQAQIKKATSQYDDGVAG